MQTAQRVALDEVLRLNARLSAEKSAKKPNQQSIAELSAELDVARVILAVERGFSGLTSKGRPGVELAGDVLDQLIEYLRNREGHTA